jgi:hypothetical protein
MHYANSPIVVINRRLGNGYKRHKSVIATAKTVVARALVTSGEHPACVPNAGSAVSERQTAFQHASESRSFGVILAVLWGVLLLAYFGQLFQMISRALESPSTETKNSSQPSSRRHDRT